MNDEDKALAKELGFDQLTTEWQAREVQNFYKTLHLRLSMVLEDMLNDEQLEAFGKVSDRGDEAAIEAWFKQAIPNYDKVVAEQTELLKNDIKQGADRIRRVIDEADSK